MLRVLKVGVLITTHVFQVNWQRRKRSSHITRLKVIRTTTKATVQKRYGNLSVIDFQQNALLFLVVTLPYLWQRLSRIVYEVSAKKKTKKNRRNIDCNTLTPPEPTFPYSLIVALILLQEKNITKTRTLLKESSLVAASAMVKPSKF